MTTTSTIPVTRLFRCLLIALAIVPTSARAQHYRQSNLVSSVAGMAAITDPLLVNPWGVAFSPDGPFWVSDNGSNSATIYIVDGKTGAVTKAPLDVSIPGPPTGQVFNGTGDFPISIPGSTGSAFFIFDSLDGNLYGWNPALNPTSALPAVQSPPQPSPSAYTGLTLAFQGPDPVLIAANIGAGRVDVFDKNFANITAPNAFVDPNLPAGDAPFNAQNIDGDVFVTFAGPTPVVDVFDAFGALKMRFATGGTLNNPWGVALAPRHFGSLSNAILIGNFNFGVPGNGPGYISAFNRHTGEFRGLMRGPHGRPIQIDGLWSLVVGNGGKGGVENELYFSAGINGQMDGLFGSLRWLPPGDAGAPGGPGGPGGSGGPGSPGVPGGGG